MKKKNQIILLGIIYSLLLFIIFQTYIEIGVNNTLNIISRTFYSSPESLVPMFPSTIGWLISIVVSLVLVWLIIHFVTIKKINDFLKPNKTKVISSIFLIILALTPVFLRESGIIHLKFKVVNILTFGSLAFSGFFEFMELFFPILVYYLFVCLLYKIFKR